MCPHTYVAGTMPPGPDLAPYPARPSGPNDCVPMDEQAKLEEYLPTATDSVLCDYVLVMVGNRKSSRQVSLDLEVESVFHII